MTNPNLPSYGTHHHIDGVGPINGEVIAGDQRWLDRGLASVPTVREARDDFAGLALLASQAAAAEQAAKAFKQQRKHLLGHAAESELIVSMLWELEASETMVVGVARELKLQLREHCPSDEVVAFVDETLGLGPACHFYLGLLPQWIAEFQTVSKLWAYCGLHVVDGVAPRRQKGKRSRWSARLKSIAIKYMAEPCLKLNGQPDKRGRVRGVSPYRSVYELRRAHTAETHPSPEPDCPSCQQAEAENKRRRKQGEKGMVCCTDLGGKHWPEWRNHKDAMRVTAKAITKDLWRVSRGHAPLLGEATYQVSPPTCAATPAEQRPDISTDHIAGGNPELCVTQYSHDATGTELERIL